MCHFDGAAVKCYRTIFHTAEALESRRAEHDFMIRSTLSSRGPRLESTERHKAKALDFYSILQCVLTEEEIFAAFIRRGYMKTIHFNFH